MSKEAAPKPAAKARPETDAGRARRKRAAVLELIRNTGRNGRNARGMIEDTPLAREAFALGEAYRRSQTEP
jgi:hypothetical protein